MAKKKENTALRVAVIILISFGFLFLMVNPALQDFRDSLAFDILFRLVTSGVILFFGWLWKKKPSVPGKWTMTAYAAAVWLPLLIPSFKLFLLALTLLIWMGIAVLLWEQVCLRKHTEALLYITAFAVLVSITNAAPYTFVENPNGIHFGGVSVVFTVLCGGFACWLILTERLKLKDNRKSERIAFCFMGFLVGFFLMWPTMLNLNYILDNHIPQVYQMPLVDKEINTSGKNTSYNLYVTFEGQQLEMEVSQSYYHAYEVGDKVPVTLCEGAFHDPFYIVE